MKKVYVGGLSHTTSELALQHLFEKFGNLENVWIVTDKISGKSRGFGFVSFLEESAAQTSVAQLNGTQLDGRTLKVSIANERRSERPSEDSVSSDAKVFVRGLSWNLSEEDLAVEFGGFGTVTLTKIVCDPNTHRSRGFGFVGFESKEVAEKAVAEMNGKEIQGRRITVEIAKPRPARG